MKLGFCRVMCVFWVKIWMLWYSSCSDGSVVGSRVVCSFGMRLWLVWLNWLRLWKLFWVWLWCVRSGCCNGWWEFVKVCVSKVVLCVSCSRSWCMCVWLSLIVWSCVCSIWCVRLWLKLVSCWCWICWIVGCRLIVLFWNVLWVCWNICCVMLLCMVLKKCWCVVWLLSCLMVVCVFR